MLRVVVEPSSFAEYREGVKNGKQWAMYQQKVRVFMPGSQFSDPAVIVLPENQKEAFPAGDYIFDTDIQISRGSFDSIRLNRSQRLIMRTPENVKNIIKRILDDFPEAKEK